MLNNALFNIFGAIGSRTVIFFINLIIATNYLVSDAAKYALIIGWANALSAVVFMPIGNLYRKLTLNDEKDCGAFIIIAACFSIIVFFVFLLSTVVIEDLFEISNQVFFLSASLSLLYFYSYVAVKEGKVAIYNITLIFSYLSFVILFLLIELSIDSIVYYYTAFNFLIFSVFARVKRGDLLYAKEIFLKHYKYVLSLSIQSILGLPVLMVIQTYIVSLNGGDESLVIIFIYLQIFNVINIVIQKLNQIIVPKYLQLKDGKIKFIFSYYLFSFLLLSTFLFLCLLLDGDFYFFKIPDSLFIFIIFSFLYFINSSSWLLLDIFNAEGAERYVEYTSYFWVLSVFLIFYLLTSLDFNYVVAYSVSIGVPRLLQICLIYILKRKHEDSSNSVAR